MIEKIEELIRHRQRWHAAQRDAVGSLTDRAGHNMCAIECDILLEQIRIYREAEKQD